VCGSFARDHPEGTIFHRPQWSRAVEKGCGQRAYYLVAERHGAPAGVLPLIHVRSRLFGNAMVSVGFGTGGGLLSESESIGYVLAEAGWALAERLGCPTLELRGGRLPAGWVASEGVYAKFDRALPSDAEALLKSIPRRQRAEIRRALDFGLDTSTGSDARHGDAHFRAYGESVRNLGTPIFPRRLFEATLAEFGDEADVVVVWKDGRPLSSILNVYDKGVCHAFWGGGTAEARRWRANDLVYFEVMKRAIARGCLRADFGRSKLGTGPWQRKRIWGFDETPLVYGIRAADGAAPREINPLNPKYRLQIAAWQRLPLWLANRIGPSIARGLG
jgi:FemAB-related protein (PEP-CTERM system-associated)